MSRRRNDKPSRESKRSNRDNARSNIKRRQERNFKRDLAPKSFDKSGSPEPSAPSKRALDRLLSGIGTPEAKPFVADVFQTEALEAIETQDVLVTAPTGSGKTWI